MKACVIHAAEDLRIEEHEGNAPGRDEVSIRLAYGGICGSDQHYYLHGKCGGFAIREPFIPGHEVSGYVEAMGEDVSGLAVGGLVAINPSLPCGTCASCLGGKANLCRNNGFRGSASRYPHVQGLLSEGFVVKASQCRPVDAAVDPAALACAEPLSVALHAVGRAGDLAGKRVVVVGARTIGLLVVLVARLRGAASVVVADLSDYALSVAGRCGAERALKAGSDAYRAELAETLHNGFDVAFEVSGSEAGLADAIEMTAPGGVLVQVGTLPTLSGHAAINQIMVKEIAFLGSFRFDEEFTTAVDLLASGRIDVRPLLTREFALEDAQDAFRLALDAEASTKVQVAGPGLHCG